MKCLFFVLISVCVSLAPAPGVEASEREAAALIQSFFVALQQGDTDAIMGLCTEPLLTQKRDLLENNPTYSAFLRQTYANASMLVEQVNLPNAVEGIVDVEFLFPNETLPLRTRFHLKHGENGWQIASEEPID